MLRRTRAVIVVAGALTLLAAHRADAADFYAAKTITISTYGAPGDSYDAYMRLLARHYGRHIPGNPRFIAINQTGAGGLVAINHAALVAPQFAVDALDSSSGHFWEPGVFAKFLDEAAERLTKLHGDARARAVFDRAPVVIVAYSGGYNPAAFALALGGAGQRVQGIVLFDGLFAEIDKFADWLAKRPPAFFFSAYGKAARAEHAELQRMLTERGVSA